MENEVKIENTQSKFFTKKAILLMNAFGVLGIIPMVIVILLIPSIFRFFKPEMALSVSLVSIGLIAFLYFYFAPIGMGNLFTRKLVHRLNMTGQSGFIVQLINISGLKSGFWAFMDDADDIGLLTITDNKLVFKGDSIELSFPCAQIKNVRRKNIGWRGFWIYGSRIQVDVLDLDGNKSFEFTERSSLAIPASRRITKEIFNLLSTKIPK